MGTLVIDVWSRNRVVIPCLKGDIGETKGDREETKPKKRRHWVDRGRQRGDKYFLRETNEKKRRQNEFLRIIYTRGPK